MKGRDFMKKTQLKNSLLLLLTATIWGVAFVAQSVGMDHVGPFTFNAIRSIIGGIVLIPFSFWITENLPKKRNCHRLNNRWNRPVP